MGESIVKLTGWPIPGNVLGMALMTIALKLGAVRHEDVKPSAQVLLDNLAFLFVPPGVGLMLYFDLIARQWLAITVAVVASTFIVMGVVGWIVQGWQRWSRS